MNRFVPILLLLLLPFMGKTTTYAQAQSVGQEFFVGQPPVKFSLQTEGSKVLLSWELKSEKEVKSFIIERSADGELFIPIYQTYYLEGSSEYIDYLLGAEQDLEKLHYRVIIEFRDGEEAVSKQKAVNLIEGKLLKPTIYSNSGNVNFTFHSSISKSVQVQVFDTTGGIVHQEAISASEGVNTETLRTYDLRKGLYFLRLEQDGVVTTTKFFVR